MKKILAIIITAAEVLMLTLGAASVGVPPVDVIVELDESADPYKYAEACAELIPGAVSEHVYDTLICGFHLRLPREMLDTLASFGFVRDIHISAEYLPMAYSDADTANIAAEMIGLGDTELTGEGVTVAILDSGFDVTHPAFEAEVADTLDLTAFSDMAVSKMPWAVRKVKDTARLRHNSKIPFMFDYAGNDTDLSSDSYHGTHVAGIIGAVKTADSEMQGIAPDAQLLLMKVFNDETGTASDHVLLTAMEDAIKLGADVINLSLGSYAGSVTSDTFAGLAEMIDNAEKSGCIVVCAVGNSGVSTDSSLISNEHGLRYPTADYTDFGTVASPAAASYPIAVGSADSPIIYGEHFRHADNDKLYISFTDTNVSGGVTDVSFLEYFDGETIEYEVIPGVGEDADYEGIDVKGKLALIKRGTISFIDKVNIAESHGAIGAVIYNNEPDEYINMELTGVKIPAVAISLADGEELIAEKTKALVFDDSFTYRLREGGKLSDFSAYGPTPSLTLKPDVTAIGGSVLSTINGGKYAGLAGTSMAAPQISGVCALMVQDRLQKGIEDKITRAEDIRRAVMNTAVPMVQENGVEYSPRAQGAGLVDFQNLTNAELSITYGEARLAKAELFDGLSDKISFDVTVANLTDTEKDVRLGVTLTNDGYTKLKVGNMTSYYNTLEATADRRSVIRVNGEGNANRHADGYAPHEMTLSPGESRTVRIDIVLNKSYHKKLARIFENGYFAEGYVVCETDNSSVSLPYMGYIGDWASGSVTDGDYYDEDVRNFRGTKFYVVVDGGYVSSGADIFATPYTYDRSHIAFSPNGDDNADIIYFGATYIRNIKSAKMTVTDNEGNELANTTLGYIKKTEGMEDKMYLFFNWDGGDGAYSRYKFPDGTYYMTVEFTLDYRENVTQVYRTPVIIDTKAPTLDSVSLVGNKLTIKASDETGVLCMGIYADTADGNTPVINGSEGTFDISAFEGDVLYYELIDYAYNSYVGKIDLSELAG